MKRHAKESQLHKVPFPSTPKRETARSSTSSRPRATRRARSRRHRLAAPPRPLFIFWLYLSAEEPAADRARQVHDEYHGRLKEVTRNRYAALSARATPEVATREASPVGAASSEYLEQLRRYGEQSCSDKVGTMNALVK